MVDIFFQNDSIKFDKEAVKQLFLNGEVPLDGPLVKEVLVGFNTSLLWSVWAFALLGIVISTGFFSINIVQLRRTSTDTDSTMLDTIIYCGSIISYISVIIYGIDVTFVSDKDVANTCSLYTSFFTVGLTLINGSILAKIWQLYNVHMTSSSGEKNTKFHRNYKVSSRGEG